MFGQLELSTTLITTEWFLTHVSTLHATIQVPFLWTSVVTCTAGARLHTGVDFLSGLGTTYADAHRRKAIQMQRVWLTEYTEQSPHTAYCMMIHTGKNSCATSATNSSDTAPPCRSIWKYTTVWSRAPAVRVITEVHRNGTWIVVCKVHMCEKPYGCDECDSNLSVQGNDFSRPCVSKLEIKPNRLSHILHLYGFSPVGCQRHHSRHY